MTQIIRAANVNPADRSGTITTGGVAQSLLPLSHSRYGFWFQNNSNGDLWISDVGTAAAAQPSLKIVPGALYESPITGSAAGAHSLFGAITAQAFSCREF